MAKLKLGSFVTDIRNSVGGSVFSHGKGGNVVRNQSGMVLRNRSHMQVRNSQFFSVVKTWRTLTLAQKTDWNRAALNYKKADVFGDFYIRSGSQYYARVQMLRAMISLAKTTLPAAPAALGIINSITIVINATGSSFTVSPSFTGVSANEYLFLYCSIYKGKGVYNPGGKYTFIQAGLAIFGSFNFTTTYHTILGFPPVGSIVFCKAVMIDVTTGQAAPSQFFRIVVT